LIVVSWAGVYSSLGYIETGYRESGTVVCRSSCRGFWGRDLCLFEEEGSRLRSNAHSCDETA
jgi:hypothetical protein